MKHRIDEAGSGVKITLSEDLVISCASELREIFLGELAKGREMTIDVSEATDMDVSALQLLCSLHRSAVAKNTAVRLEQGIPQSVKDIVKTTGFLREHGCSLDSSGTCLWKGMERL